MGRPSFLEPPEPFPGTQMTPTPPLYLGRPRSWWVKTSKTVRPKMAMTDPNRPPKNTCAWSKTIGLITNFHEVRLWELMRCFFQPGTLQIRTFRATQDMTSSLSNLCFFWALQFWESNHTYPNYSDFENTGHGDVTVAIINLHNFSSPVFYPQKKLIKLPQNLCWQSPFHI